MCEGKLTRPMLFSSLLSAVVYSMFPLSATSCSRPLTQAESRGQLLYRSHCYECHDESQPELKKAPPALHNVLAHRSLPDGVTPATEENVRQVIVYGLHTMPPFSGRLTDAQVADLIAFLHRK